MIVVNLIICNLYLNGSKSIIILSYHINDKEEVKRREQGKEQGNDNVHLYS